jgi:hypothetical protein
MNSAQQSDGNGNEGKEPAHGPVVFAMGIGRIKPFAFASSILRG